MAADYLADWPPPVMNPGSLIYRLLDFPPAVLPSGGDSNMISASEMIVVCLYVENYRPKDDAVTFEWHRVSGGRPDTVIYTGLGPDFHEKPGWTTYWSWDCSFVGRFPWEIDIPGSYYVMITSAWGGARIDFAVVD